MRLITIMTLAASMLTGATLAQGQSAADAYQSALQLEEIKGDLDKAILAYKNVLERFPNDRVTAAKAQLHLGFCYERLSRPEAREAYEAVVRNFSDQPVFVAQAKAHLASVAPTSEERVESAVVSRQMWTGADVDVEGKPSLDGRYLTYVDWTSTKSGNVGIRDLTTGQNRRLTDSPDMGQGYAEYPVLSPEGKTVAYTWHNSVRLIGVDGSRLRVLVPETAGLYPFDLVWSPDGTRLAAAFTDYAGDKTSRIVLISVVDGSTTQLKSTGWRSPELGGFSPDGRFLVFALGRSATTDDRDIVTIAIDGSGETVVVPGPSNDTQPLWTPDGKAIIFMSDRSGSQALWAIRVDRGTPKGSPELIRPNVGEIWLQGFTRDGSFFYGSLNRETDVYVATLDPSTLAVIREPAPLTDRFVGSNAGATWSPDGRLVAFLRGTDRRSKSVVIRSVGDGDERTLPAKIMDAQFPTQNGVSWFPDSRSILLSDTDIVKRKSTFRRVDIETGQETLVFDATYQAIWPLVAIAPDGRSLFYTTVGPEGDPAANNRLHLMRRDVDTGTETELYSAVSDGVGFFGLSISPDGRQLAFMANVGPNQRHLLTLSAGGGTPVIVYRGDYTNPQPQSTVWTRDGKHILIKAEDGKQRTRVWAVPVDGGPARRLDLATQGIGKMDLSPDGKQLAFTGLKRKQELWTIKNLVPASFSRD